MATAEVFNVVLFGKLVSFDLNNQIAESYAMGPLKIDPILKFPLKLILNLILELLAHTAPAPNN